MSLSFSFGKHLLKINFFSPHEQIWPPFIPKIKEWADLQMQVNLAISLQAPNDEIRSKLMPINKAYNIAKLMGAIDTI